jgi:hypothetical protein
MTKRRTGSVSQQMKTHNSIKNMSKVRTLTVSYLFLLVFIGIRFPMFSN